MQEHDAHSLPAGHALDLAELVKTWGVSREDLFQGFPVPYESLTQADARIPLQLAVKLIERARSLTGEPALGFYLGVQMRVPAHGYLGFAAMTAGTLREALQLAARYAPTRTSALRINLAIEQDEACLYVDEVADLGSARDVILTALAVGLWQIGEALTGRRLIGRADLAFPEPAYARRFDQQVLPVRYGMARNCMRFDAALLDAPLAMANATALRLAQEQCERALEGLDQDDFLRKVRSALPKPEAGFHSLEEVAASLGVSSRTLKRKLKAEGAIFSTILEEMARVQAVHLLETTELSVEQVAERVGYSDVSNFGRAFRRWTGTTPAAFRRGQTP